MVLPGHRRKPIRLPHAFPLLLPASAILISLPCLNHHQKKLWQPWLGSRSSGCQAGALTGSLQPKTLKRRRKAQDKCTVRELHESNAHCTPLQVGFSVLAAACIAGVSPGGGGGRQDATTPFTCGMAMLCLVLAHTLLRASPAAISPLLLDKPRAATSLPGLCARSCL